MNTYEVKSNIRQRVTLAIAVLSLILGNSLFGLSNSLASIVESYFPKVTSSFSQWDYLGIFSSQITVAMVFSFIKWLFEKHLWRTPLINKFLGVPDLNGSWEGVLESSYKENDVNVKVDMKLEIEQSWSRIKCTSIFPTSKSYSDLVCLDYEGPKGTMLKFTYTNHSENINLGLPQFAGYNELRLNDANTLAGTYYTQREPSTKGTIILIRRDAKDDINEPIRAK